MGISAKKNSHLTKLELALRKNLKKRKKFKKTNKKNYDSSIR